jgi:hypothetical protein
MDFLQQAVAVLCLILLVCALVAPALGSNDVLFVLPVAGFLYGALLVLSVLLLTNRTIVSASPVRFVSLRAPPLQ